MGTSRYDEAFQRDAVALAKTSGKSRLQLAKDLGIYPTTLRGWIAKYAECKDGTMAEESDQDKEIKRLKKELVESQKMVELLKKATAFFAAEETKNTKG